MVRGQAGIFGNRRSVWLAWFIVFAAIAGCSKSVPVRNADVIVIGAGIAGLSAALEAADAGAQGIVIDVNSVAGGHAMMAGGMFLVGTPLQEAKGVHDSPDLAFSDIMKWGEDADAGWVRRYVEQSRREVYDWLTGMGVEFRMLIPAPGETSVPRFHFGRGGASTIVTPMMRKAFAQDSLQFLFNVRATGLHRTARGLWRVATRNVRSGVGGALVAPAVIVATGGFENDLDRVRANWLQAVEPPEKLLLGAGHFALGTGLDIARQAGAHVTRLDHQTIFVTGLPDPRDATGRHGLLAQNPAGIFVDARGRRFMDESASRKLKETTVLGLPEQSYWLVFDSAGLRSLRVRGAPWLTQHTLATEILDNPALVAKADSIEELARRASLPPAALVQTVQRFNTMVGAGTDEDFGRFGAKRAGTAPAPLHKPPFYAMHLYPMTRKSMGGLKIDDDTAVTDANGAPIPGLFGAGEVTGVAGINGSYGGSGTFLGPSVLLGRIAGRSAAALAQSMAAASRLQNGEQLPDTGRAGTGPLAALVKNSRPGYWHFEAAHTLVLERGDACTDCHNDDWPARPARTSGERLIQLESCGKCH